MSAILQRLKYELKTEKRKVGTLAVLTLAGLLLWGKLLIPAGTERASGQEDIAVQSDGAGGSGEGAEREPIPELVYELAR